jgi:hypothetical protein
LLYLFTAARFFMAASRQDKAGVFGLVLVAAVFATGANYLALKAYFDWNYEHSTCTRKLEAGELGSDRMAESLLKDFARNLSIKNEVWDVSVRAEGRVLIANNRFKGLMDLEAINRSVSGHRKSMRDAYCADGSVFLRKLKATETFIYYSSDGQRLTSFSITPADCVQW